MSEEEGQTNKSTTIWNEVGLSDRAKVLLAMAPMNMLKLNVEFPTKETKEELEIKHVN